ncbi:MAG: hypothetical protein K1X68_04820 [Saprospiraceae bacterium]|nr:hypothetical protein [Saprospiraceae bacterium]HMW40014.1 hypothetical protein [Saprospiraceae bacterium]HMX89583.1 hypothetical protein [Saprospiraceae bacterium]HMZ41351.1 hypothetical protein [Saprospiraceae bacterium]HNA65904.1 hypothetical protein [Saprospiraceae bacterium]
MIRNLHLSYLHLWSATILLSLLQVVISPTTVYLRKFCAPHHPVHIDTLTLMDSLRQRPIPIAIYRKNNHPLTKNQKVIILNHGYNDNRKYSYLGYSFLAEYLAAKNYFVISIQHELPNDSLLPRNGIPQIVRRPFWERGADNILFVIQSLRNTHPELDFKHLTLIGHSNGGDMTALFAQQHPLMVNKLITLDNRRMPLPRTNHPQVYSLRSSDQLPDEGVLPDVAEIEKYKITIVTLPHTAHNDMCDAASTYQRREMIRHILNFLKD